MLNVHIISPKLRGKVAQLSGNSEVRPGSRREPGASGLISPSTKTIMTTVSLLAFLDVSEEF